MENTEFTKFLCQALAQTISSIGFNKPCIGHKTNHTCFFKMKRELYGEEPLPKKVFKDYEPGYQGRTLPHQATRTPNQRQGGTLQRAYQWFVADHPFHLSQSIGWGDQALWTALQPLHSPENTGIQNPCSSTPGMAEKEARFIQKEGIWFIGTWHLGSYIPSS